MRGEDPTENCHVIGRFQVGVQQAEVAEVRKSGSSHRAVEKT